MSCRSQNETNRTEPPQGHLTTQCSGTSSSRIDIYITNMRLKNTQGQSLRLLKVPQALLTLSSQTIFTLTIVRLLTVSPI
jgi:hypothetical protein